MLGLRHPGSFKHHLYIVPLPHLNPTAYPNYPDPILYICLTSKSACDLSLVRRTTRIAAWCGAFKAVGAVDAAADVVIETFVCSIGNIVNAIKLFKPFKVPSLNRISLCLFEGRGGCVTKIAELLRKEYGLRKKSLSNGDNIHCFPSIQKRQYIYSCEHH